MMSRTRNPEPVGFITTEANKDLIVSFAIEGDEPGEVISLILLRTPEYEIFLDEHERGIHVSHEAYPDEPEYDMLRRISWTGSRITIETVSTHYDLDVSRVDTDELQETHRILKLMNFDRRFTLEFV
jgi:hypothetical protein